MTGKSGSELLTGGERSSIAAFVLVVPFLLLGLFMIYLEWTGGRDARLIALYAAMMAGAVYWMTPVRSPRHWIARRMIALGLLWAILVVFVFTFLVLYKGGGVGREAMPEALRQRIWLVFLPWTVVYLGVAIWGSAKLYRTIIRAMNVTQVFSRYVAPAVVLRLIKSGEDFDRTDRTTLSVLFLDLRNFTATSSGLNAEQVKELLNSFMGVMIPVAHEYRGTVDKTVGDEIMLLFGAPIPYDDHADQAVRTAAALHRAHREVEKLWVEKGLPVLEMGIGINTGEMVVGNIGCPERMDFTVVGHHVNLAARLCSAAKGKEILISEYTMAKLTPDLLKEFPFVSAGDFTAKGIGEAIKAYSFGF
jgi:adenylate cyclase